MTTSEYEYKIERTRMLLQNILADFTGASKCSDSPDRKIYHRLIQSKTGKERMILIQKFLVEWKASFMFHVSFSFA